MFETLNTKIFATLKGFLANVNFQRYIQYSYIRTVYYARYQNVGT